MGTKLLHDVARAAVLLWAAATGPAAAQGAGSPTMGTLPFEDKALHGDFASEGGCEVQPAALPPFKRVYHFAPDGAFRMERTLYADPACKIPLVSLRLTGTYRLGPPSPKVAEAREAELTFATLHMTPHDEGFIKAKMAGCGSAPWVVDVEQDVSATGCLTFQPLSKCSMDYDIVQLRNDVLYPGVRNPGMCMAAGRPVELQPTGARRQG